jgi:cytochrome b561
MSRLSKLLHWFIFLAYLGLMMTALAANWLFSKEAIMDSFAFSMPALGIDISPSDQLFIARLERRFTWALHFWIGIGLFSTTLLHYWLFLRNSKHYRWLNHLSFALVTLLFLSGLPLFLRIYFNISASIQIFARILHEVLAWGIGFFVVGHILWVILQENGKRPGIISNMFDFKGRWLGIAILILTVSSQSLWSKEWYKDLDYQKAMAYKSGKIGLNKGIKKIENCPYAKCDEVAQQRDHNVKIITTKTKNFPRMVIHLKKSFKRGNPLAAKELAKFLLGRIDYRSKVPDPMLIKIGERDTGMPYTTYVRLAKEALYKASESGDCYSMYQLAEFWRNGWMGLKTSKAKAEVLYRKIIKTCDSKSFFYMMSQARIR